MRSACRLDLSFLRIAAPLVAVLSLAACASVKHNDVLVFATQTKVALDVSANATTGGSPSVTFGYKREEGVWMPLVVNGMGSALISQQRWCPPDSKDPAQCVVIPSTQLTAFRECAAKSPAPECLKAMVDDVKYVGKDNLPQGESKSDTYSVFASFGGDFGGGASGAKAALAQFFATGIAAQKLAANPGATKALKAEDTNAQVVEAKDEALKATQDALRAAGGGEVAPATKAAADLNKASVDCWNKNRTAYRAAAKTKLAADSDMLRIINEDDEAAFRNWIAMSINDQPKLLEVNTAATCS